MKNKIEEWLIGQRFIFTFKLHERPVRADDKVGFAVLVDEP